ncbi:ISAs1 family transposase [Nitrosococcus wardiae]|uniref:ISAs1 family transposase n=1 Tax=Nitrosococcus wardiae TaxID=1814290 RepID=A0A4P7C3R9_9GAMM|nr:ISAs1 family transposase [Nitrosococcus wardiae]
MEQFSDLEDPRCAGKIEHQLIDILVIAICGLIACAENWEDIALYGCSKLSWLRQFLALPNGIPSHDTFRRVFMLIDPQAFEACFTAWVGTVATPGEREVVAIDGKTVRRSFDRGREQSPLHLVSAWASEQGVVLGQHCVDEKSNEITAIPELLESLALENTLVTMDAMGCQKDIAQRIVDRQADYLRVLKANHGHDYAAVQKHFEQHCFGRGATAKPVFDAFDESHGRRVRRRVFASPQAALLETLGDWPRLHTVLAVEAIRGVNGSGKVEAEIRYFLSSFTGDPLVLAQAIRRHGSIENNLHWVLDVTFREDDSRVRDPTAVRHFALLRKIAINLLGRDRSTKTSLRGKRKKAAWDDDYMLQLLQANFMR